MRVLNTNPGSVLKFDRGSQVSEHPGFQNVEFFSKIWIFDKFSYFDTRILIKFQNGPRIRVEDPRKPKFRLNFNFEILAPGVPGNWSQLKIDLRFVLSTPKMPPIPPENLELGR